MGGLGRHDELHSGSSTPGRRCRASSSSRSSGRPTSPATRATMKIRSRPARCSSRRRRRPIRRPASTARCSASSYDTGRHLLRSRARGSCRSATSRSSSSLGYAQVAARRSRCRASAMPATRQGLGPRLPRHARHGVRHVAVATASRSGSTSAATAPRPASATACAAATRAVGRSSTPSTGLIALRPLSNIDPSATPSDDTRTSATASPARSTRAPASSSRWSATRTIALTAVGSVFLPFGDDQMLLGDANLVFEPKLAFEWRADRDPRDARRRATSRRASASARCSRATTRCDAMQTAADAKAFLDVGSEAGRRRRRHVRADAARVVGARGPGVRPAARRDRATATAGCYSGARCTHARRERLLRAAPSTATSPCSPRSA